MGGEGNKKGKEKTPLPLEEDEEQAQEQDGLQINRDFAEEYHERKRRQELAKAREAGLLIDASEDDHEEESSSSEEEDEGEIPPSVNAKVMGMIEMIRNKDPKVYDSSTKFFRDDELLQSTGQASGENADRPRNQKAQTARDVVRQQILDAERKGTTDAFDSDDEDDNEKIPGRDESAKVYNEEQAELRNEFLKTASEQIANTKAEDGEDILEKKRKIDNSTDPYQFLKANSAGELEELGTEGTKAALQFMQEKPKDEGEAFLHDFLVQQKWKQEAQDDPETIEKLAADIEEDEEAVDQAEAYEAKCNFRFEEQEGAQIQSNARHVPGSMRREEPKRARQRENKKLRKEEKEKEEKERMRQLKALKEEELRKYLKQMIEVAGSNMTEKELEKKLRDYGIDFDGDFDSTKWDKAMEAIFDESYYDEADAELDLEEQEPERLDETLAMDGKEEGMNDSRAEAGEESHSDDSSKLLEKDEARKAIEQAKQVHEELANSTHLPSSGPRFKYREVAPNSWGLTADDILGAKEKDLNQFVSLKKLAPYRDSEWSVPSKLKRNKLQQLRSRLEKEQQQQEAEADNLKKQKRKEKRERKKVKKSADAPVEDSSASGAQLPNKNKKRKTHHNGKLNNGNEGKSRSHSQGSVKKSRLASYNIKGKGKAK
eukprot:gb/GECG01007772.1/.p1 GENE.gb/GECG01007772.1/~~gb/GECG01007772.1/.p1  ORF type:complete len:659 (+),score=192.61 gb/GECG01007772.1/:1-1977(+)